MLGPKSLGQKIFLGLYNGALFLASSIFKHVFFKFSFYLTFAIFICLDHFFLLFGAWLLCVSYASKDVYWSKQLFSVLGWDSCDSARQFYQQWLLIFLSSNRFCKKNLSTGWSLTKKITSTIILNTCLWQLGTGVQSSRLRYSACSQHFSFFVC